MTCFHPFTAYQRTDGQVVFAERGDIQRTLTLPCGQCVGCALNRSRQWAVRCMHEAQMHERNAFLTLTYDDVHLPESGSLVYPDFQMFMRRLRKFARKSVRFYMCGEYGEINSRPHYHALLFGFDFPDMYYWATSNDFRLYRSPTLERLWPAGQSMIGKVTFQSAAYCSRYIMKKRLVAPMGAKAYEIVNPDTGEIFNRVAEFNHMSLKPGVGGKWFERFHRDVYPEGSVVVNGVKCNAPRYYDKRFALMDFSAYEDLQLARDVSSRSRFGDNGDERLRVKEIVQKAALRSLVRPL